MKTNFNSLKNIGSTNEKRFGQATATNVGAGFMDASTGIGKHGPGSVRG